MDRLEYIYLSLDEIEIGERRAADAGTVKKLAQSIKEIGLQHPITVRKRGERGYVLVAGRHRLEAVRLLGERHIKATVVSWGKDRARMWEISENLHRAELTKLERAEQIEEWRALRVKGAQVGHPSPNQQPHDVGVSATAEELGVTRHEIQRARELSSIRPEAKEAAREAGLDDNQSALLRIAAQPQEQQLAAVREIAEARGLKIEQDVQNRAAQEVAEILAEHIPSDLWDGLKANLHAAGKISTILAAFNNLIGQAVMDRRFG